MENPIKVLLADDHQMFTEGLGALLDKEVDLKVVGHAKNGNQVIEQLPFCEPDVLVLDINMPGMDGIQTLHNIESLKLTVKVLILSTYDGAGFIEQVLKAGAKGYVLKGESWEEIRKGIREVAAGSIFYSKTIAPKIAAYYQDLQQPPNQRNGLSQREKEVLALIADGKTAPQIGDQLCIAPSTVDKHRRNILLKLNLQNSLQLVRFAIDEGYV